MQNNYKIGDRVVIRLSGVSNNVFGRQLLSVIPDCDFGLSSNDSSVLGKLEDFQSAQKRIKMTVEEKKEFDKLRCTCGHLRDALNQIVNSINFPILKEKLIFGDSYKTEWNIVHAWYEENSIQVVEEDVRIVKVAGMYLWKRAAEPHLSYDFDEKKRELLFH
ncbi:MAG: hypothetical protein ABF991_00285 [Liquorilactobacillus hordei]|uniref:hypothetical protein n=1 Tax=Liquorilactobacillus hordei TaxID=468911 RepID=UPI0039EC17A0